MSSIKVNSHGEWVYTLEEIADALNADISVIRDVASKFYSQYQTKYDTYDTRVIINAYKSMSEADNKKRLNYLDLLVRERR